MKGRIHSFQSLGTVDGPGIRNVVFMQGCPLRCACCHNPDTWDFNGGEEIEGDKLIEKIFRFRSYFGSDGGVTVSGGEPLCQAEFLTELFSGLKNAGINTALDTSGCIYNEQVEKLLKYTDLVLLDYKYAHAEDYLRYTKCDIKKVDLFISELEKKNIPVWIRRVIIPGLNDDESSMLQLKSLREKYTCIKKIELLPFRKLCIEKYQSLGISFPFEDIPEASKEKTEKLEAEFLG
ncbi:MAG: pyruvate formate-lyase-activating protein [Clostridia bacterium]|nr:pyruvate formate-lyase-activating protein [Clostridia bacterium]